MLGKTLLILDGPKTVSDGVVLLREIRPSDSMLLYRWRMDPKSRFLFRQTALVPLENHEQFVARYFDNGNRDRWFIIEVGETPIGSIALYNPSRDGREYEWGRFVIAPAYRGQGYGSRALKLLRDYAANNRVERLHCEVLAENSKAAQLYRSTGFVEVGFHDYEGRRFLRFATSLGEPP